MKITFKQMNPSRLFQTGWYNLGIQDPRPEDALAVYDAVTHLYSLQEPENAPPFQVGPKDTCSIRVVNNVVTEVGINSKRDLEMFVAGLELGFQLLKGIDPKYELTKHLYPKRDIT